MTTGRSEQAWIATSDGVRLAATLHLPAGEAPAPALLEALPYRKDDLTAGYRPEYVRFRDEHGYAVVRVDVRGTGSSDGIATDEYPAQEQRDLVEVVEWIAAQPWCSGAVGMFGTSYSGFNALHLALGSGTAPWSPPAALRAVIALYSSDDRYSDDVHYMGGLPKLLDLVDYPLYMVAMNALPPVPSLAGDSWRDTWRDRVARTEPWLLRWLEEQRDGVYWRQGSVRPSPDQRGRRPAFLARSGVPTMLVGGWADGYRNNTLRTVEALRGAGVPVRLLLGPWSHASPNTALPGPRVDIVPVMAQWWDKWLRPDAAGPDGADAGARPDLVVFARASSPPEPDLDTLAGEWQAVDDWPSARVTDACRPLDPALLTAPAPVDGTLVRHRVEPDVGTAAWISCAGHLPWGQPDDQRGDDARSLTWEWPADGLELLGQPRLVARVAADQPVATLSVRLCDVSPDGRSTLVARGVLNLTHRRGSTAPEPLPVDELVDVELEVEATSWRFAGGHRLRLSVSGTDWPNTIAPPRPVTLTLDLAHCALHLPVVMGPANPPPELPPSASTPDEPTDVTWRVDRDVLQRRTTCTVDHGSTYDEDGVTCTEHYAGSVSVDTRTFRQTADARAEFVLRRPEVTVSTAVGLRFVADEEFFDVALDLECCEGDDVVMTRSWHRRVRRDLC